MVGLLPGGPDQRAPQEVAIGRLRIKCYVRASPPLRGRLSQSDAPSGGLIIATVRMSYFCGRRLVITFETDSPGDPIAEFCQRTIGKFVKTPVGFWPKDERRPNASGTSYSVTIGQDRHPAG